MKIESLTQEQEAQLITFREEWRKIGLSTGPADLVALRPVINDFYGRIDKTPPYLWRCQSPLQANLIIALLKANLGDNLGVNLMANLGVNLGDNLMANLRSNLGANLWDNLRDNLWANLGDNLRANLWDNLRDNLWANLGDNLGNNLRANLGANLGDNLGDNLWDNLGDNLYTYTSHWGSLDSYWIAYYLYPHQCLRAIHTVEQTNILSGWSAIARNSFWWYPFENICFVCDRPNEYHFDERWRLHNQNGMAVRFSDDYGLYAEHGVIVPAWIMESPENLTVEKIRDERNTEIRRVMIGRYGQSRYLNDNNAKLINSDGYGDLYRAEVPDDEPLVMVKVVNSTPEFDGLYRDYFVRVPPDMRTAEQAVAWLGGFEVGQFEYVSQS
jgi:hypothetical protein